MCICREIVREKSLLKDFFRFVGLFQIGKEEIYIKVAISSKDFLLISGTVVSSAG